MKDHPSHQIRILGQFHHAALHAAERRQPDFAAADPRDEALAPKGGDDRVRDFKQRCVGRARVFPALLARYSDAGTIPIRSR